MEEVTAATAADQIQLLLSMLDFYWFEHQVLSSSSRAPPITTPPPQPTPPGNDVLELPTTASEEKPRALQIRRSLRRSLSEEITATSLSPTLLIRPHHKLDTILSGKESSPPPPLSLLPGPEEEQEEQDHPREGNGDRGSPRRKKDKKKSKSLSELEFEELKGFMDLGFTFSENEAADPRLASIVPGLQRLGRNQEEDDEKPSVARRPYLSEVWEAEEAWRRREREVRRRREEERALRNWRIPAAGDDIDLKDHIRYWAHTVASAVR